MTRSFPLIAAVAALAMGATLTPHQHIGYRRRPEEADEERDKRLAERELRMRAAERAELARRRAKLEAEAAEASRPKSRQERRRLARKGRA